MRFTATILVNFGHKKFRRLLSDKSPTLSEVPGAFCPSRSEESKFALHHSCLFLRIFSRWRSSSSFFFYYLLSLEKSHRRDVPPRKLNSSNEQRRAGVIEKTSCEIGKAFLSSVIFFWKTTGQFNHDRKKCAKLCRNKFRSPFSRISIFL